jgi:hypothetical protein
VTTFTEALIDNDPAALEQEVIEAIEAQFEDWEPAEGDLETWLTKAFARIASTVRDQAAVTSAAMFKKFGETIANVPPILAAPATALTTWTMVDNAGYTIPAGTEVSIAGTGDESFGFRVVSDVTVAPGATTTKAGEVVLEAIEPGVEGNGLSATPEPISAVAFVESVALLGETSGGVDEEDEDAYLDRLIQELQLLSLSLIVPRDFEIDARAVAGVARALCIPAWNGEKAKEEALAVTVIAVGAAGAKLSTPTKEVLQERQEAKVPSGVLNFVGDPTITEVDIEAKATVLPGFDPEAVKAAIEARLSAYLDPANWGLPTVGDPSSTGWVNTATVYLNELISEVDRVQGVGRVVSLKLAKAGGSKEAKDLALTGLAPLTTPKTLTVTVE